MRRTQRSVFHAIALTVVALSVDCSRQDAAPSAPTERSSYLLRVRRTDGVSGAPTEDSVAVTAGQSLTYAFQPAPGYVSVSVRLDSAVAADSGTIRMSSDRLLAVGARPSITSAPRDSSLATTLASIPAAVDPRAAALAAVQRIDSLVRTAGSADAIKSASNAVALAATTPLSIAQRLRADSAMWDVSIPLSVQSPTSTANRHSRAQAGASNRDGATDQLGVDIVYLNGLKLRYEKFLSEVPTFQTLVRDANVAGDVQATAYYTRTSGVPSDLLGPRSECDALTWIDALESRSDYVDLARRFGRCIGTDAGQALANIANAFAPGVSGSDAAGAITHVTKSLRASRPVILVGYAQGALVSQEVIRGITAMNDPKFDAGNCLGFVSIASPSYSDDVVAAGLGTSIIAKGAGVRDLISYVPGANAAGMANELTAKHDAENASLKASPSLRSAHEIWSAYRLHDFATSYESKTTSAAFVQSKLRDIASAVRARCGLGRELAVSSNAISLAALTGTNPGVTTIAVSNVGLATIDGLAWSVSYGAGQTSGWLAVSLDARTTPATLTISATSSALPSGTYSATVTLTSSNAAVKNAPLAIPVALTVAARPALGLQPGSLIFSALAGSPAQTQQVYVTNAGAGTLDGLSAGPVQYVGQASGWLTATFDRSTAPATLSVTPNYTNLAPGTYTATIPVQTSQSGVTGSPRTITVTAQIAPRPPSIALSPSTLSFSSTQNGPPPATQSIQIANGGSGTLDGLSVSAVSYSGGNTDWLSTSLSSATAPATMQVSANPGSLAPGSYTATFTVGSTVAGVSPRAITATLAVTAPPILSVSSTSATFSSIQGAANPSPQTIQVSNTGQGTLSGLSLGSVQYVGLGGGWLSATLDRSTAPATLTLTPNLSNLQPGPYSATFPVQSSQSGVTGSPRVITVSAQVSAPPPPPPPAPGSAIVLSSNALSFSAVGGQGGGVQTVQVTNAASGALGGLSVTAASSNGWLTATISTTTTPATMTVFAHAVMTQPGTYSGTLTVASTTAGISPATIAVTLTHAPAQQSPGISLFAAPIAFSVTSGATCPSTAGQPLITVNNGGGGTLNGLSVGTSYPTGTAAWLSASLSATTAPATVSLRPSCAAYALPPGTYTGTVMVSSSAPGVANSPQSVAASLVVGPATTATTGSITISASGLPSGSAASVFVNSNLYQTTLTLANNQSATLKDLLPNLYNVVPGEVHVTLGPGPATYSPSPPNQFVNVTGGSTGSASFTYAQATGYLRISATGIPSGCTASYSFSGGQSGGSGPLTSAQGVFAALVVAGTYTVNFGPPTGTACAGTTLHAASATVTVTPTTTITQAVGVYVP